MTTPRLAVETDNGRFYTDPNPAFDGAMYPSVTNVLSVINKPALVPAAAKEVAEYAMASLPRLVKASRDPDAASEALRDLKSRARVMWDAAADRGTRVHALIEARALGLPLPEEEPEILAYFSQFERFCREFGVDLARDVVVYETSVVNRTVGYAGTLDMIVNLCTDQDPGPVPWLLDFKTSAKRARTDLFSEFPLQLAGLRHAETVWLRSGLEEPMPRVARCGILNLRQRGYALMPVEAGAQQFAMFKAALTLTRGMHAQKLNKVEALPASGMKAVA